MESEVPTLFEESSNNMEPELSTTGCQPSFHQRLFSAVAPVLLIAIGYIDPGKWAVVVDSGARYGSDLVSIMLVFNLSAAMCHYISAQIALVTGKNLVQVCSEEYDRVTCIFLGILAELSLISLDLSMILGTAHGLNLIFGIDLFTCVFLTAAEAILFPVFSTFLENGKSKFLCIFMACSVLLFYVLGVLTSQTGFPLSLGGIVIKSSGECAFALMSLLGASIIPHNLYLHSSIVQLNQKPKLVSKGALCHDQLFAILCVFCGIFLVNYKLMNSAANEFHNVGLVLLTFQDALSLMDQVFRSPIAQFVLILIMFLSNQVTALAWNLGRQVVLYDFLGLEIPGWLHHVTIRMVAIVPALCCVYKSGGEGIYQLLIFTQVMVAVFLPASLIPLFRIASSSFVMGIHKVSQLVEFLSLIILIGMIGLKIAFVIEMLFGNSDWVSYSRWNVGSNLALPYIILLITTAVSLCLMLWLLATPLKSASVRPDAQTFKRDMHGSLPKSKVVNSDGFFETAYCVDEATQEEERLEVEKSLGSNTDVLTVGPDKTLPLVLLDSERVPYLTTTEENQSDITFSSSSMSELEGSEAPVEKVLVSTASDEISGGVPPDAIPKKSESKELVDKSLIIERDLHNEKDDVNAWEAKESPKEIVSSSPSLTYDGPPSFRSVGGKSDDLGSGAGSLSRLAGLGRAARRQLTTVLDEFWKELFDYHGDPSEKAKLKKWHVLLGMESKIDSETTPVLVKVDNVPRDSTGYFPSVAGRGFDPLINPSLQDPLKQQRGQSVRGPAYGVQRGLSSLRSSDLQLLDAYGQNPSSNTLDTGERRYSSLRLPASSDGYDNQPATIHGYKIASYFDRISKEHSLVHLNGQVASRNLNSPSSGSSSMRESFSLGRRPQNGLNLTRPPGFSHVTLPRNTSLQPEVSVYDIFPSESAENAGGTVNAKKFYSLPDISGLSLHQRVALASDNSQWNNPTGYGRSFGPSMNEQSPYSNYMSKSGVPLAVDDFSPSKVCRDVFPLQFNSSSDARSLWCRQPYEQFGVADKTGPVGGERVGTVQNSLIEETTSTVNLEAQLLKSFRHCIVKLLKLEGSDWLFSQNDGVDEELIDRVAAREKFLYEAETREINREECNFSSNRKHGSTHRHDESDNVKFHVTSVPHCGEGCIWKVDLIISFGVWCIHRILDLSVMESRPELWGKYTFVLNLLQGIIDLAFSKPRTPMTPCFCLQVPATFQQKASSPVLNGSLPRPAKQGRGKCTTAAMLLEIIKDVEIAISCRKGRLGTAAGDVAFPKGKENISSVLKRYRRRLANKPVGCKESGTGSSKGPVSPTFTS